MTNTTCYPCGSGTNGLNCANGMCFNGTVVTDAETGCANNCSQGFYFNNSVVASMGGLWFCGGCNPAANCSTCGNSTTCLTCSVNNSFSGSNGYCYNCYSSTGLNCA